MKKKILIICIALFAIKGYSQDSIVNYLDFKYKKCLKETALYVQTVVKKGHLWQGTVYYSSGRIKFKGNYKEKTLKTKIGLFKKYNEKGNLKSIQKYNLKGKKEGAYLYFSDKGLNITKGYFLNDKKEGVWKYFDELGNKRGRLVFKKDKVLRYKLWDQRNNVLDEKLILFRQPEIKGGLKTFKYKLRIELINDLKKKGLKTNFLFKCNVNEFGKVQDITIMPKLKKVYEEKIIEFFSNIKNVKPAILVNMKVAFPVEIPIILK